MNERSKVLEKCSYVVKKSTFILNTFLEERGWKEKCSRRGSKEGLIFAEKQQLAFDGS